MAIAFAVITLFFGIVPFIGSKSFEKGQEAYDRKDFVGALEFFKLSALFMSPSSRKAQGYVGEMYYFGKGVEQNYETAFEWLLRSAEEWENSRSQYMVGYMYANELGVKLNSKYEHREKAIDYYTRASHKGHLGAQENLCTLSKSEWFKAQNCVMAAEQGSGIGASVVGFMYSNDQHFVQDYVKAYMWFDIATRNEKFKKDNKKYYKAVIKAKNIVAKKMSASNISKARKLAQKCVASNYKGCVDLKKANQVRHDINLAKNFTDEDRERAKELRKKAFEKEFYEGVEEYFRIIGGDELVEELKKSRYLD